MAGGAGAPGSAGAMHLAVPAGALPAGVAPGRGRRPRAGAAPGSVPLRTRFVRRAAGLPDARLLDRLMRGRGWIALIGLALMGVVFMQVSLLKLNTGIGRAMQTAATLERQNAELRGEVALLDGGERLQGRRCGDGDAHAARRPGAVPRRPRCRSGGGRGADHPAVARGPAPARPDEARSRRRRRGGDRRHGAGRRRRRGRRCGGGLRPAVAGAGRPARGQSSRAPCRRPQRPRRLRTRTRTRHPRPAPEAQAAPAPSAPAQGAGGAAPQAGAPAATAAPATAGGAAPVAGAASVSSAPAGGTAYGARGATSSSGATSAAGGSPSSTAGGIAPPGGQG
jgi:hypothetical protein